VPGFRRRRGGVEVRLSAGETAVLRQVVSEVEALLTGAPDAAPSSTTGGSPGDPLEELVGLTSGPVPPPADPALARLLPDGYTADPEAAAELRRLTEASLRAAKVADASVVLDRLPRASGTVRLDDETAGSWLRALNDVRLALGTRLEVTEDLDPTAIDPDDPAAEARTVYLWLGWLQETLVEALTGAP